MLPNRSLRANSADARWFVPTEAQRLLDALVNDSVTCLLTGGPGSGRTTTLRMLQRRLEAEGRPVCFVSFSLAGTAAQAIVAIHHAASDVGWIGRDDRIEEDVLRDIDPYAVTQLVRRLSGAPARAVMLVDDVDGSIGHEVFGRLRDELWQLNICWIVAAAEDAIGGLLRPPADAFFARRIKLRPLLLSERRQLIEKRLPRAAPEDAAARAVASADEGEGYPRELIARADLVASGEFSATRAADVWRERRNRAETEAGTSGIAAIAALERLGPVSSGDPELLARLGWSRPRAVEVLSQLERAGLVRGFNEQKSTPGRPRKLFELVEPRDPES